MGRQLTFEIGRLNPRRIVKVFGRRAHKHGQGGTLVESTRENAVVELQGSTSKVAAVWSDVRDWTSHNPAALVMPSPGLNGTTNGIGNGKGLTPTTIPVAPKATPMLPAPPPEPKPFAVYADLGSKLEEALAEVSAAEDLVDEALESLQAAKAQHEEAVARVTRFRTQAHDALKSIDLVLAGTSGHK